MNTWYEQWLSREDAWGQHLNKKQKKNLFIYVIFTPVISMAVLFALGFAAGGGMTLAVHNIRFGAAFGVGIDVVLLLVMLPGMPGKRYKKQMSKEIKKAFSLDSEREEFAAQMMGVYGPDTVECISWKDKMTGDEKVWITKDYIWRTTGTGNARLIQLKLTDHIELDARTCMQTAGNSNMKIRYNTTDYPIIFRIPRDKGKPAGLKEKLLDTDPYLVFDKRDIRDQVVQAIKRLSEK